MFGFLFFGCETLEGIKWLEKCVCINLYMYIIVGGGLEESRGELRVVGCSRVGRGSKWIGS